MQHEQPIHQKLGRARGTGMCKGSVARSVLSVPEAFLDRLQRPVIVTDDGEKTLESRYLGYVFRVGAALEEVVDGRGPQISDGDLPYPGQ